MKLIKMLFCLLTVITMGTGCAIVPHRYVRKPVQYSFYLVDEGYFVAVPTGIGAVVGLPTTLVITPLAGAIDKSEATGESQIGEDWELFLLGPAIAGDITGTPFLIVKKTIWDFPRWLFIKQEEDPSSN